MLNLEWFRTFKAIYEKGTLTAAAEVLFLSQPGVSLHLNALESYTGFRLFQRENRRMVPTEKAEILYNFVLEPIGKLEQAEKLFHRNSRLEKPTISVGLSYEYFVYALEKFITELPFNLIVRTGECRQIIHGLEIGELDLILTPLRGDQPNLEFKSFSKQRMILVCGAETDTVQLKSLIGLGDKVMIRDWLKDQRWFSNAAEMETLNNFWILNFDTIPDFKPNIVLPNFSNIIRTLKSGKGFAVVPDYLCRNELKNQTIKLVWESEPMFENMIFLGKRVNAIYRKEIEMLEQLLTRNWANLYDEEQRPFYE
jgi:DNA-binding transcriptional LysR family regulator